MGPLDHLGGCELADLTRRYRDLLRADEDRINALNVYPVPDRDTGTNMVLTVEAVVAALPAEPDVAGVCRAWAKGSLLGARGSSGVITAQILRSMAGVIESAGGLDVSSLPLALQAGAQGAVRAVREPVAGTMITVVGEIAARAAGATLADFVTDCRTQGRDALDRTPMQLPALHAAGVVDAGGAGFLLLLDALADVVIGTHSSHPAVGTRRDVGSLPAGPSPIARYRGPRFEVMFVLEREERSDLPDPCEVLARRWEELAGQAIAIVGGDGTWSCHVHIDDVGGAIEAALDLGRPRGIAVDDLARQVAARARVLTGAPTPFDIDEAADGEPLLQPVVATAVVAVAPSGQLGRHLRHLGAQRIVAGGHSMNPTVEQLHEAIAAAPAGEVVVLPNHPNLLAVARRVASASAKRVRVIPSISPVQGLAALWEYRADRRLDANVRRMRRAVAEVTPAWVTRAGPRSEVHGLVIAEGDWLGVTVDGVRVVDRSLEGCACRLLDLVVHPHHRDALVCIGADAWDHDNGRVLDHVHARNGQICSHIWDDAAQPVYAYLFGVR